MSEVIGKMADNVECSVCYQIFDNSDQENNCLTKHPVCKNCLGKWLYRFDNMVCCARVFTRSGRNQFVKKWNRKGNKVSKISFL